MQRIECPWYGSRSPIFGQRSPIFGPLAGVGVFEVLLGGEDLEGATVFHTSFFPLFVQVTNCLPDFAVAPALEHLLPGVFDVALTAAGENRRDPMSSASRDIE